MLSGITGDPFQNPAAIRKKDVNPLPPPAATADLVSSDVIYFLFGISRGRRRASGPGDKPAINEIVPGVEQLTVSGLGIDIGEVTTSVAALGSDT